MLTRSPAVDSGLVQMQAMAGDKLWMTGVELAERASPRRRPRTGGVDLSSEVQGQFFCFFAGSQAVTFDSANGDSLDRFQEA